MGIDNYWKTQKRSHLKKPDAYWNVNYFSNIDRHHASLMYSHYAFRRT